MKSSDSFFKRVHDVARRIPYGRVTSYGAIAKHLGSPQSARMVGWAMNNSFHASPPVPAHRVLNRNGMLTGKHHFGSSAMMQQLLENEGIRVADDCVADWEKVFWEPEKKEVQSSKVKAGISIIPALAPQEFVF